MTLETFFEKFDLFADAPDAVAKRRELVLHWAVQGRLVRQDSNEDPASKLIRDAVHARKKLVAAKVVRDETPDLGFLDQIENGLPNGWVLAPLSVYVGVIMGQSPPSSAYNESGEGLPFYQGKSQFGKLYPTATDWCTEPTKIGEPGDVVISVRAPVGPTNMLREKSCIGRGLTSLRSLGGDQMHLLYTLRAYERTVAAMGVGSTFVAISKSDLDDFWIPIPPHAEQKRIVAKVDELMALCDRLELQQQERETRHAALARASLARFADAPTPANLNLLFHPSYAIPPADLRKSILTLAVQGKLVPQDPNDEPAARVLGRIDATPKRAMRTRATDEENGSESTDLEPLFELPPGWEWAPFRRLPLQASVGIDRGRSMQGPDRAVGYFKMNNIRNSGGVDLSDFTRIDATPDEIEAFSLTDGDFLFNTRNSRELVGKTCVFRPHSDEAILYNNNILRVKFIDGFCPDFLDYWFRSPQGSAELQKLKSNTTNVCAIYQGKLSGFPCVVPPLAEQRRIVAKVEQLMALVDALETQLAASRATAANLLSALVAELTGTPNNGKVSVHSTSTTGGRGRPRKSM